MISTKTVLRTNKKFRIPTGKQIANALGWVFHPHAPDYGPGYVIKTKCYWRDNIPQWNSVHNDDELPDFLSDGYKPCSFKSNANALIRDKIQELVQKNDLSWDTRMSASNSKITITHSIMDDQQLRQITRISLSNSDCDNFRPVALALLLIELRKDCPVSIDEYPHHDTCKECGIKNAK